ncbi:MAG: diaminopimelate decarboxylase [Candidatus Bipolaricaulaceae bacterium]
MTWGYRDGALCGDDLPLTDVATRFGTPCYVYSAAAIVENVERFRTALAGLPLRLCYAVKANSNLAVLSLLARQGLGAEVVSAGELLRALRAGFAPADVLFTGVGKRTDELRLAMGRGVGAVVVESTAELRAGAELAPPGSRPVPVALRLHPGLDPHTHPHLATGKAGSKFGLDPGELAAALAAGANWRRLALAGFHVHLGSQIRHLQPYADAFRALITWAGRARGLGHRLEFLDLGGGFAAGDATGELEFPLAGLAEVLRHVPADLELVLEPGRALVASAGVLLTTVVYVKSAHGSRFAVVDAGMNDLLRPALYGARHHVLPVRPRPGPATPTHVVGPVCESADHIAHGAPLPPLRAGDLLAVMGVGAYGFSMASQYNSRPRPAEVLLAGGGAHLVRRRESWEDLWRGEESPACLR